MTTRRNPDVSMIEVDVAHAHLIMGLVSSFKPKEILEFGYGGGRAHRAIMAGVRHNNNRPNYTLVDSWLDFGGSIPKGVRDSADVHVHGKVDHHNTGGGQFVESFTIATREEKDWVNEALVKDHKRYDFIMSDADHHHSHEWSIAVYDDLLASPGILIYHDVDGCYPGLAELPQRFHNANGSTMVFNKSSRDDEACERGLLVVFKK